MSRRLSAIALAMAVLVGAVGLKTVVTAGSSTQIANGPDPLPSRPTKPPTHASVVLVANGPDPLPSRPTKPTTHGSKTPGLI